MVSETSRMQLKRKQQKWEECERIKSTEIARKRRREGGDASGNWIGPEDQRSANGNRGGIASFFRLAGGSHLKLKSCRRIVIWNSNSKFPAQGLEATKYPLLSRWTIAPSRRSISLVSCMLDVGPRASFVTVHAMPIVAAPPVLESGGH